MPKCFNCCFTNIFDFAHFRKKNLKFLPFFPKRTQHGQKKKVKSKQMYGANGNEYPGLKQFFNQTTSHKK